MNTDSAKRPYRMGARAASSAATAERILDATIAAFWESPGAQMSLDDVARRAGVTVQTVIRRFGNKERLVEAASERESGRVAAERDPAAIGDVEGALRQLLDHYERRGDQVMRMLAEEQRLPGLKAIVDRGRVMHRDWCRRIFAEALAGKGAADRRRRLAQLVAVCDVYTWKLLRRDAGLSRRQTELALFELIQPLIEED